jgi:hypothetical protein
MEEEKDDIFEWKLEIRRAFNGYILKGNFHGEDISEMVVAETDDELAGMEAMLTAVKEYFGIFYDDHAKKNLIVEIRDGQGV